MDRNELHDLLAYVPSRPAGADPGPAVAARVRRIRRRRVVGTALLGSAVAIAVGVTLVNLPSSQNASRLRHPATQPSVTPAGVTSAPGSVQSTVPDIAPTPGTVTGPGTALISVASARAKLSALNSGASVYVALAEGGYDGVSYDQAGHLHFWFFPAGGAWTSTGASTYPLLSDNEPPDATVSGGLVSGSGNDVFVVSGEFTGDGSGNSIALAKGPTGWGTLAPLGNTLVTTGHRSTNNQTPGVVLHAQVTGGQLITEDDNLAFDTADGGAYPLVKHWTWASASALTAPSGAFTAAQVAAPPSAAAPAAMGCPATAGSGTYLEDYSVAFPTTSPVAPTGYPTVVLTLTPPSGGSPCRMSVPATTPIALKASTTGGSIWISAPLWLTLAEGADNAWSADGEPTALLSYAVPASLHVTGFSSTIGGVSSSSGPSRTCQVVIRDGHVVGLEMTETS